MTDLDANAGVGGAGAPPDETTANRAPVGLTRQYAQTDIRVLWFASRCIHSGACIRALPSVFDPGRRPWVNVDAADADAIASAVVRCPTGALQYERLDGGPNEPVPDVVLVTPVKNGPNFVRGPIELKGEDGIVRKETRVALCRCGQSKHMPFCDNTHRAIGFRTNP